MRIANRKTKGLGEPQPGKKKQNIGVLDISSVLSACRLY